MDFEQPFPCCIAREVGRWEFSTEPNAIEAMDEEWSILKPPSDQTQKIEELSAGISPKSAKRLVCATKHAGPAPTYRIGKLPNSVWKKDVNCQKGTHSADTTGEPFSWGITFEMNSSIWAEFAEFSSNPPSMEASRAVDAVGSLDGYRFRYGDAKGAYTQSYLLGVDTWVALPENRWPKHWRGKYKNPLVPLILALYGHPDAGGCWEAHCEGKILALGFVKIAEEWKVSVGIPGKEPYSESTWTILSWPRDGSTTTSSGRHSDL